MQRMKAESAQTTLSETSFQAHSRREHGIDDLATAKARDIRQSIRDARNAVATASAHVESSGKPTFSSPRVHLRAGACDSCVSGGQRKSLVQKAFQRSRIRPACAPLKPSQ